MLFYKGYEHKIMAGLRTNKEITERKVLLIDEEGNKLGVLDIDAALSLAKEKEADLVEVSASTENTSAVCRIMNYGKFKFQSIRIIKKNKKKKNNAEKMKEMRLTIGIHENDLSFKRKHVMMWIEKGHKVRIYCLLKGANISYIESMKESMEDFVQSCNAKYDSPVTNAGRTVQCIVIKK